MMLPSIQKRAFSDKRMILYFRVPNNRRAHIIDSMQEFGLIVNRLDPNKSSDAIFLNYP